MSADVHTLIGPWALDAVDADERLQVERHLAECASCAQEAAELRETVARLADVTVIEPPPRLRDSVLAEVRRTRQEAPVAQPGETPPAEAPVPARRRRHRRRTPRLRLALGAAALAVVAAFAGVFVGWAVDREPAGIDEGTRIAAVLEAPDAEVDLREADGGGRVVVVSSAELDAAVVVVSDLADVGEERSYQVWKVEADGQVSAGVMDPGDSSATMLVEGLGDTEIIGVTNEPAGGSTEPTLPMVADVDLSA
ncbi:anti-sigma factor [Glycomyces sp. TRM65418]|uniref:anti-sigma factor n=1 Tax=Glycomyces sp. TRM65418 TaxID=2867006 RepID=UPI001CE642B3|nr:anti-sigma factor [Glycomyces sp. TRM65418]MCC3764243.1 anti-sigma factor [Glycomyces sp. TRM65418]QZD53926.1 anti-sigma factor [Glycomyces sp. TRM65418]